MLWMFHWSQISYKIKIRFINLIIIQLWILHGACYNGYPKLLKLPQDYVFTSSVFDPISFNVKMSPCDVQFLLTIRNSEISQSTKYDFQILYNSSKDLSSITPSSIDPLTITVLSQINRNLNFISVNITLNEWIRLMSKPIHIIVMTDLGSIISSPIKIQQYHLSKFDETGNEHVEFVMGNVAQILCSLPNSKPSPPNIKFQHNSHIINISNSSRYKLVEFPPLFNKVALLIRSLVEDDSGKYQCIAYIPNTKFYYISNKTTHLMVKKPTEKIPIRFLFSSHFNFDDSKIIDVKIPEGTLLVLYCVYESAPIDEVNWYWSKNDRKYELDQHFGTLTIANASLRDNSDISCMNNEDKIFRIHVYQKAQLIATPSSVEINEKNMNKSLILKCKHNQNDPGFYVVHWFFNGVITEDDNEFEITNNSLTIKRLSEQSQGIYQCWSEIKNEWLSQKIIIYFPRVKSIELPVMSQTDVRVDTGSAVDLRCQIPSNLELANTTVEWSKEHSKKDISNLNLKYEFLDDVKNNQFILKIKSPSIRYDSGKYICKIFMKENRKILLRKTKFKLLFNKILEINKIPEVYDGAQEPRQIFTITKPNATIPEKFLLAVNVTWALKINLPDVNNSKIVNHYRIEYKQGSPRYRPIRRSGRPMIEWGNATVIDKLFTTVNCFIHNPQILKPQYWYRFRALGIYFTKSFFDNVRSPWSDPINFEHVLPFRPKITNVTVLNSATIQIAWFYGPMNDVMHYLSERDVEFRILFRALTSEQTIGNSQLMPEQVYDLLYIPDFQYNELPSEKIETLSKISPYINEFDELNLTHLKSNTRYIIAMYAIHRPIKGMSKMFTALSDPYLTETIPLENKSPLLNENIFNHIPRNQTNLESNYFRNKILFLVLGSLAGILFVIALFMFVMCLWYQIRYHNKKRQNISSTSSVKTSSANTFAPIGTMNQIPNNSVFIASSNIVSPQGLSPWNKTNRFPVAAELPHLFLAQHLSLWSPNHLAQFNLPQSLQDPILDESKISKPSRSPTTLSTPSPKSNIDIEINNLDGSIEDSQEESVRLLDYQSHSSCFKREEQCTLNNAFSVKSEGRERQNDQDGSSDNTRSISHYPFSPSALELYSHKKKSKFCSSNRKDLSNIKLHLKQPKLQNSNYFLPIRSRLSCFFPSAPSGESPPPCTPVIASLCKENSLNQYNRMKKDETFAEHPFLTTDHVKNGFINNYGNGSFKYPYSPANNFHNQKLPSKFIFDPIHDLQPHEDSRSNSTSASARQFLFSLYPDGVRPCINLDLDKQGTNSQTNL